MSERIKTPKAPAPTLVKRTVTLSLALAVAGPLGACSAFNRLEQIGAAPALSAVDNPAAAPGYKPVQFPQPVPVPALTTQNSLWRSGSRAFFKDQRANQVGDILTVHVSITDKAKFDNETKRSRNNSENLGAPKFFGLESQFRNLLPNAVTPESLVKATSDGSSDGKGSVDRKEEIVTDIAAVVLQVLPNGNLVIEGKQEVRVNFEVRELIVAGVVRPEDIEAGNVVQSSKIAQARISYGGRGQITDVQQPRYGQQVLDVLLPF
ncbi:MAG: flagellar basal body L-ring protein FlgH [Beijerinckiaceae bacterium]|nr:flagellar basal body L-ring protein FlgH [Beijerinckiaceae bacterium]